MDGKDDENVTIALGWCIHNALTGEIIASGLTDAEIPESWTTIDLKENKNDIL
jgi:hypothetical protein